MKPRTHLEKMVAASNAKLTTIASQVIAWAFRNVVCHIAFRTSGHKCCCSDCGEPFDYKGKGKYVRCPHCGCRLEVMDTLQRRVKEKEYFSTLETLDGLQVQRVFLLTVNYYKGKPMETITDEVCRLWLNADGHVAVTALSRSMGYYIDSFNWDSDIELRRLTDVHWMISDTKVYPYYSAIPQLRRNGLKGKLPNCHPMRLMKALLTDNCIETLMKTSNAPAAAFFVHHPLDLNRCWPSFKVAMRHHYQIADFKLWCDTIRLLDQCGRDLHNVKYICPKDLTAEHDKWLRKVNVMEEKRRSMEQLQRAKQHETDFYKEKSRYFGIILKDDELEISVLDSLDAYKAEGDAMKHCVFRCEYYAKSDTLVLSAHDKSGNRVETIEFSLTEGKVIQSRGVCNTNTPYHDRIIRLVNENANRFLQVKKTA